jgi:hypothetical protein
MKSEAFDNGHCHRLLKRDRGEDGGSFMMSDTPDASSWNVARLVWGAVCGLSASCGWVGLSNKVVPRGGECSIQRHITSI